MVTVNKEMAQAAKWRGDAFRWEMPIVYASYEDGDEAGQVELHGLTQNGLAITHIPGTHARFDVALETLTVSEEVAEHLERAASWQARAANYCHARVVNSRRLAQHKGRI